MTPLMKAVSVNWENGTKQLLRLGGKQLNLRAVNDMNANAMNFAKKDRTSTTASI